MTEPLVTIEMRDIPLSILLSERVTVPDGYGEFDTLTVGELVARRITTMAVDTKEIREMLHGEIRAAVLDRIDAAMQSVPQASRTIDSMIINAAQAQLHGDGGTSTPIAAWIGGEVMNRLRGMDVTRSILDEFDRAVDRYRAAHLGEGTPRHGKD